MIKVFFLKIKVKMLKLSKLPGAQTDLKFPIPIKFLISLNKLSILKMMSTLFQ